MRQQRVLLAFTGASGAIYGVRLGEELLMAGVRLTMLISRPAFTVLMEECGLDWGGGPEEVTGKAWEYFAAAISTGRDETAFEPSITYYAEDDFLAPIASGSSAPDAMVICPCSMGTTGRIAAGLSGTLIERSADVMLKERRPLLLVPRETPVSAIHLENLLKLARAGACIVPAMPAFYHRPATVDDLVNFVVGKVLDQLGVENSLYRRWGTGGTGD